MVTWLVRRGLPLMLFGGVVALLVRKAAARLGNTDTYFHLRFGQEFLDGWSLRDPGSVSSTATADWTPTQWLPQVVMATTEDRLGLAGVAWLSGLLFLALAASLYWATRRVADPLAAVVVVIVALMASNSGLSMRPQVLSYVATVVTVAAWMRARDRRRPPFLLVPLTWAWAACHGMWPLGIVIGAVAVAGLALDRVITAREAGRWALVPVLAAVAGAATPVGPELYRAVLLVNSRAEFFSEWQPVEFTSTPALAFLALLVPTLVLLLRQPATPWFELLLVLLALGFALYSNRTLPVAAAVIAPFAAAALQSVIGARTPAHRAEKVTVAAFLGAGLVVLAIITPRTAAQPPAEPAWLEPVVGGLPVGTRILNDWAWGGYVMWRFPEVDPVIHGYADTFTTTELERNRDILELRPGWDDLVRDVDPAYALLSPEKPLAYALEQSGWQVVHSSEHVVLLEPPAVWSTDSATGDADQ